MSVPSSYKKVSPVITRPGGKSRMIKTLLPIISKIEHKVYCEPFAGGAAILLAKPPSYNEVINDLDGSVINLYRQIKHHLAEMLKELRLLPCSRALFDDYLALSQSRHATEIQRAAAFAYCNFFCFGADNSTFGVKRLGFSTKSFLIRKIILFSKRIDRVTIENLPWQRCVDLYDCKEALFFFDPPYTSGKVGAYDAWSINDVKELRARLDTLQGNWIVTLNDCAENRAVFDGCRIQGTTTAASMRKRTQGQTRARFGEIIITP